MRNLRIAVMSSILLYVGSAASAKEANRLVLRQLSLGPLALKFEETTLSNVIDAVGRGAVGVVVVDGQRATQLCYKAGKAYLLLRSDEEMGGGTKITNFEMSSVRPVDSQQCWVLPKSYQPLSINHHFGLGSSEAALQAELGYPQRRTAAMRHYEYIGKVPGQCEGGFDLFNWLEVTVEKGTASAIRGGQVTSC